MAKRAMDEEIAEDRPEGFSERLLGLLLDRARILFLIEWHGGAADHFAVLDRAPARQARSRRRRQGLQLGVDLTEYGLG
ncbi:hypothetical protein [Streptomyces sp. NPDC002187]|uniref:hypothetical protein n=1 Tax=Streptomyces sp. NPDC002187 TaxID=3364637 RepID=UPI0036AB404E